MKTTPAPTSALILDFTADHADANAVSRILTACAERQFTVTCQRAETDTVSYASLLRRVAKSRVPAVCFLVFGDEQQNNAIEPVLAVTHELVHGPVEVIKPVHSAGEVQLCLQEGASAVWAPPLNASEILGHTLGWLPPEREESEAAESLKRRLGLQQLIGNSAALLDAIRPITGYAKSQTNLLIYGETGTGKEMCARAVHDLSKRAEYPFIAFNCGGIPAELVENELFGHEAGAYTGATGSSPGLVRQADRGTLFLDEVNSLAHPAQANLLRFLDDKRCRALGSQKSICVDVRVIAATNCDLEAEVEKNAFRRDLYYRLAGLILHLPPLRARGGDVKLLAHHFLRKYVAAMNKPIAGFSPSALNTLGRCEWLGNVRQLEGVVEQAVMSASQGYIQGKDIRLPSSQPSTLEASFKEYKYAMVQDYLRRRLKEHDGNVAKAATACGVDRRAFYALLHRHGLRQEVLRAGRIKGV